MFTAIVAAITSFFKSIPILDRWFTKTASEKIADKKKDAREDIDNYKKTGRPKW